MVWRFDLNELRRLLAEKNLTVKAAADKAGVPEKTIYRHLQVTGELFGVRKQENKDGYARLGLKPKESVGANGAGPSAIDDYPTLTRDLLDDIDTLPSDFDGRSFRASGRIGQHGAASEEVTRSLGAEPGAGAAFRMDSTAGIRAKFDFPLYTATVEHGRILLRCARLRERVTAIVRVLFDPILPGGFHKLGPNRRLRYYALVVQEIEHPSG